jgi:hypothetical protein
MSELILQPVITRAGTMAAMSASNAGIKAQIATVAIGSGRVTPGALGDGRNGYDPSGAETALASEFARYPIGSVEQLADNEVLISVLCDGVAAGRVREIGYFLADGTLFALWSSAPPASTTDMALFEKSSNVPMALALTLALYGLPSNSVTMIVGAPSVTLTIVGPFASLSAEVLRLQSRALTSDVERYSTSIQSTWF